jgi:hypothetical protein
MACHFPAYVYKIAVGWKWPKVGGLFVTIPILFGFIVAILMEDGIPAHMLIPFIVGVLYIIIGYAKIKQ